MFVQQLERVADIRPAVPADLDAVKRLADANRAELGFVLRPALAEGIDRGWLYVALQEDRVIGFAHFRMRRDGWTTVYEICADVAFRRQGIGRALLTAVHHATLSQGRKGVRLKCPVGSAANQFYAELGLRRIGEEQGKRRALIVWQWEK